MSERCCGNCMHSKYDVQSEDFVCENTESDNFSDWVSYSDLCEEWEDEE